MNDIHETAIIGDRVELGDGNHIGPYSVIENGVCVGSDNWIGPNVVIGTPPEHKSFFPGQQFSEKRILIGDRNVIREMVVIQGPTSDVTIIGSDCYIMHGVHIAHDNFVGSNVTVAPGVVLGGHVQVGDFSNLGIGAMIHQYIKIGGLCMVGMGSVVVKDVIPGSLVMGIPARKTKLNLVGFQRFGVETLSDLDAFLKDEDSIRKHLHQFPPILTAVVEQYLGFR
jgi:UDP-N-acetylglucosamine acyltransferase